MAAKTTDTLAVINDYLVVLALMNGFRRADLNTLSAYDTAVVYYFRLGPEYFLYEAQDLSSEFHVARIPKSRHIKIHTLLMRYPHPQTPPDQPGKAFFLQPSSSREPAGSLHL